MKVYTFPQGGISFEDPTVPSYTQTTTAFLPRLSVIPLDQYSGARAYPVVSVGDYVREGMLIGQGRGPGQTNVHATVPGKVLKLISWKTSAGDTNEGFVVRLGGAFEKLGRREEVFPWQELAPFELRRIIADYGIVEMEGAGRPLPEMFPSLQSSPEALTLVVRCVFDDPWLAADRALCRERLKAVVEGSVITARAARAKRILFALSRGAEDLGEQFLAEAESWVKASDIPSSLVMVGARYPQRNHRELELVLRSFEKKEGLPLGILLVLGPASLAAVHDAVKLRKPILDRYVAVGGSAVRSPRVLKVRVGTRIGEVFSECGGFTGIPGRIAIGSPLSGRAVANLDEPILKTSFAVFALRWASFPGAGLLYRESKELNSGGHSCIGCGECRRVCPVGLDPEDLFKRLWYFPSPEDPAKAPANLPVEDVPRAAECHRCGCCELVCPSSLPLSSVISGTIRRENR